MEMDKPIGQGRSRVADLVAVGALLCVALGYVVYQNIGRTDVSSDVPQKFASSAPGTEGAAGATSNSPTRQLTADAGQAASAEPAASIPQNGQSRPASLPTNDIAYVQKRRADIRSKPSERGPLAGRAYKGTKLSVVSRSGKWVQIESGETKGWVSARLLGPRLP